VLFGGNGNDSLDGGLEADTLDGGAGADTLRAGEGSDQVIGGGGADLLAGGLGDDLFIFIGNTGADRIEDFEIGFDKIEIGFVGVTEFADLRISENAAGDAVVAWGSLAAPQSVTLAGISVALVTDSSFGFL
jgi:Ca2+-binding RTX toxin-like protein